MTQAINSPDVQAQYWNGPITRKEAQDVFDEYAQHITALQAMVGTMNAAVTFLFEKCGTTPEEFNEWFKTKTAEPIPTQ